MAGRAGVRGVVTRVADALEDAFPGVATGPVTRADLAKMLRWLRRREARRRGGREITYRELAAKVGWSYASVGQYFTGAVLPPTDRLDALIQVLGASPAEQRLLATIRDRLDEGRLDARPATGERVRSEMPIPRELPGDVPMFVGREAELAELDRLLGPDSTRTVAAVVGAGGVGKTALAVHWAHRVAGRFPDGQLYVNLRGYDSGEPLRPAQVLARFLRSLGMDTSDLSGDVDELAARYRTVLAGRRVLVLLDNARNADQVRPLLPGSASCLVLVTSRDNLPGLVATSDAYRIELGVLPAADAVELLGKLLDGSGGRRWDNHPEWTPGPLVAELARQCGGLPLALRLAAELAASRPGESLTRLVAELADERQRLSTLEIDDAAVSLRSVFSWSYHSLAPPAAHAFTLLGIHPGMEIDAYGLAALADSDLAEAAGWLQVLARAHLVETLGAERYTMHDLVRAYAVELAEQRLGRDEIAQARVRLLDYYRHTASRAMDVLYPRRWTVLAVPAATTPTPDFDEVRSARAWLDAERTTLVAAVAAAADHGLATHATDLSQILWQYLDSRFYADAERLHDHAVRAGGPARAAALTYRALARFRQGSPQAALDDVQEAVRLLEAEGEPTADGPRRWRQTAYTVLGVVQDYLGDSERARASLWRGLEIAHEAGDRHGQAGALMIMGFASLRLDQHGLAADLLEQALAIAREVGDTRSAAVLGTGLGAAYGATGRYDEALKCLNDALAGARRFAERRDEVEALVVLASVHARMGKYVDAIDSLDRALAISRAIGDQTAQCVVLTALGEVRLATGDIDGAREHYRPGRREPDRRRLVPGPGVGRPGPRRGPGRHRPRARGSVPEGR